MELTVETKSGIVEGLERNGVKVFKGIPYAEGYTGEGRFSAARPKEKWEGIYKATSFSPAVPQMPQKVGGVPLGGHMDEESLCVNVWAPENGGEKCPVMVWIYGGSFVYGDCRDNMYDGEFLARKYGVIVVTLDYRLNALGFLDFSSILEGAQSNVGLRDQTMALEWIYNNIEAFGGDRENITVFGQSAGGHSVTSLLTIPSARKYISKAIALSSYPLSVNTPEKAAEYANRFLEILSLRKENAKELYRIPAMELVRASKTLKDEVCAECGFEFPFCPVVDGEFMPFSPIAAAGMPHEKKIPLIIGTVADEGSSFSRQPISLFPANDPTIEKFMAKNPEFSQEKVRSYYSRFPQKRQSDKLGGDILFCVPSLLYADRYSRYNPVWVYRFTYYPLALRLGKLFCMHGSDVPFAFNNLGCTIAKAAFILTPIKTVPNRLKDEFSSFFASFARTGQANFTPYSEERRMTMEFGTKTREVPHPLIPIIEQFEKTDFIRSRLEL